MTSTDTIMFVLPLMFAFVFSILALAPRGKAAKSSDPANYTGIFYAALAMALWWVSGIIWPAVATSDMFIPLAWLWFGIGFIFLAVVFAYVFLVVKAAVAAKRPGELTVRENNDSED